MGSNKDGNKRIDILEGDAIAEYRRLTREELAIAQQLQGATDLSLASEVVITSVLQRFKTKWVEEVLGRPKFGRKKRGKL